MNEPYLYKSSRNTGLKLSSCITLLFTQTANIKFGYSSESALSQAFKRELGYSPHQYKIQQHLDKKEKDLSTELCF